MDGMSPKSLRVAVLGASDKPDRTSNLLIKRLLDQSYQVMPINAQLESLEGQKVYKSLADLPAGIDVLTLYVNASRSQAMADAILNSGIPRVIFNPGAENPELEAKLQERGIDVLEACSLVLLSQGRL
jgi:uncharacterized protein